MRKRSKSGDRRVGSAYSSGLSKSYADGINSMPRARPSERYICKNDYGQTRYRTRSAYDHDYTTPRYNTFSGYRKKDQHNYSSYDRKYSRGTGIVVKMYSGSENI